MQYTENPIDMLHAHETLCAGVRASCNRIKEHHKRLQGPYGVIPIEEKGNAKEDEQG